MSYIGNEPIVSATRTVTEIVATAGQTVFNANGGYTVGYIDVFVNGAQLQTSDFTATNGTSITLNSPAVIGDDIRLVAWGTFSTLQTVSVANGGTGQTSYTNGQLLIGNSTGNTLTKATLTAGTGISITNGAGSITISATSGSTSSYSVQYFVVGGGGGGGGFAPGVNWGAGGSGGFISTGSLTLTQGTSYTVTVGAAGGAVGNNTTGGTGGQSVFGSITANGGSGGAGGGAAGGSGAGTVYASPGNSLGGPGAFYFSGTFAGGGSGGNPGAASGQTNDDGTWYGGGAVATAGNGPITHFTRFNSGGGGSGSFSNGGSSQAGASGVVILAIPTANYSGTTTGNPRVSHMAGYVMLTFKSSGSYTA